MKVGEINSKLAKLDGWELVPGQDGTFMERIPDDEANTIRFVRPVASDTALATATRNVPELLTFGTTLLAKLHAKPVVKIMPFDVGIKKLDSFLSLCPGIAQFLTEDNVFGNRLMGQTTVCYAINHIEFAGNETEHEAIARKKKVRLVDLKRDITPVIYARYQKQNGQRSQKHLVIGTHAELIKLVTELHKDGGFVELENWERVRLSFTKDKTKRKLEATFAEQTKPVAADSALELLQVLTHKGANAAEKLCGK